MTNGTVIRVGRGRNEWIAFTPLIWQQGTKTNGVNSNYKNIKHQPLMRSVLKYGFTGAVAAPIFILCLQVLIWIFGNRAIGGLLQHLHAYLYAPFERLLRLQWFSLLFGEVNIPLFFIFLLVYFVVIGFLCGIIIRLVICRRRCGVTAE